jgi:5-methylcytosine-specific restriction protein A
VKRPCLDCGQLSDATRCPEHRRAKGREKRRPGYTNAERERRALVVAQWRRDRGDYCPGYNVPPHLTPDLTADHITPVAAGGAEGGPLTVLCRACNARKRDGRGGGPR